HGRRTRPHVRCSASVQSARFGQSGEDPAAARLPGMGGTRDAARRGHRMIEALRGFTGKARALFGAEHAPGVAGVTALGIAYAKPVDEVAELVGWCGSEGVPIGPAGGCTWLCSGRPPANPPLVVSVRELVAVSDYEPADLVVSVQAGVTLSAL